MIPNFNWLWFMPITIHVTQTETYPVESEEGGDNPAMMFFAEGDN